MTTVLLIAISCLVLVVVFFVWALARYHSPTASRHRAKMAYGGDWRMSKKMVYDDKTGRFIAQGQLSNQYIRDLLE